MEPLNIVDKIWNSHVVAQQERHPVVLAVDFMLIHEVTSAQAFQTLRDKDLKAFDPGRLMATLDHSIPTRKDRLVIYDDAAKKQVETLRKNAKDFGIPLYDFEGGQGIVHVIGPELGVTQPGMTIVCGDSHTATHGAFGALAFGIGTSEVANVMATGCLLQKKPLTMKVEFRGSFQPGVFAKDAILKLISEIGVGGATGHVIEYTGEAVRSLTMEERMTICNMSIECGARAGLISPDQTTIDYIEDRTFAPAAEDWDKAVKYWKSLPSDSGCSYSREITIDVSSLAPMVTWGTNPSQAAEITSSIPRLEELEGNDRESAAQALDYIGLEAGTPLSEVPVDWAFLGSCTNGRIEDLRVAAKILEGRQIHPNVTFYVVPGSEKVMEQALLEGLDKIFIKAGADFRMPGCSLCLAMNDDRVPAEKRCVSSSNRNFRGRSTLR